MMDHRICFYGEKWLIIRKLSLSYLEHCLYFCFSLTILVNRGWLSNDEYKDMVYRKNGQVFYFI